MDYEVLQHIKKLMIGPGEAPQIAQIVRRAARAMPVSMLDVGCGDGHFMAKILKELEDCSKTIALDVVEPNTALTPSIQKNLPSGKIFSCPLDSIPGEARYDLIVLNQSIYYLGGLESTLASLRKHMKPGSIAIINIWSEKCVLYKLAAAARRDRGRMLVSAEKVITQIDRNKVFELGVSTNQYCGEGKFDLEGFGLLEIATARSIVKLLTRDEEQFDEVAFQQLWSNISSWEPAKRGNCLITVRREA